LQFPKYKILRHLPDVISATTTARVSAPPQNLELSMELSEVNKTVENLARVSMSMPMCKILCSKKTSHNANQIGKCAANLNEDNLGMLSNTFGVETM